MGSIRERSRQTTQRRLLRSCKCHPVCIARAPRSNMWRHRVGSYMGRCTWVGWPYHTTALRSLRQNRRQRLSRLSQRCLRYLGQCHRRRLYRSLRGRCARRDHIALCLRHTRQHMRRHCRGHDRPPLRPRHIRRTARHLPTPLHPPRCYRSTRCAYLAQRQKHTPPRPPTSPPRMRPRPNVLGKPGWTTRHEGGQGFDSSVPWDSSSPERWHLPCHIGACRNRTESPSRERADCARSRKSWRGCHPFVMRPNTLGSHLCCVT